MRIVFLYSDLVTRKTKSQSHFFVPGTTQFSFQRTTCYQTNRKTLPSMLKSFVNWSGRRVGVLCCLTRRIKCLLKLFVLYSSKTRCRMIILLEAIAKLDLLQPRSVRTRSCKKCLFNLVVNYLNRTGRICPSRASLPI